MSKTWRTEAKLMKDAAMLKCRPGQILGIGTECVEQDVRGWARCARTSVRTQKHSRPGLLVGYPAGIARARTTLGQDIPPGPSTLPCSSDKPADCSQRLNVRCER